MTGLRKKWNPAANTPNFTYKEKIELLRKTNEAVAFESFLHTKFVGQKRFSLEGGGIDYSGIGHGC